MSTLNDFNSIRQKPNFEVFCKDRNRYKTLQYEIDSHTKIHWLKDNTLVESPISLSPGKFISITSKHTLNYQGALYAEISYRNTAGHIPLESIKAPNLNQINESDVVEKTTLTILQDFIQTEWPGRLIIKDENHKIRHVIHDPINVLKCDPEATADFAICNNTGHKIYISHKAAGNHRSFRQYAGISDRSGLNQFKQVISFKKQIVDLIDKKQPCFMRIANQNLINCALFGNDWGTTDKFNQNNVHILAQGIPVFEKIPSRSESAYILKFSNGYDFNSEPQKFLQEMYLPVIGMLPSKKRNTVINGQIYNGIRIGIYPYYIMYSRKNTVELKYETI